MKNFARLILILTLASLSCHFETPPPTSTPQPDPTHVTDSPASTQINKNGIRFMLDKTFGSAVYAFEETITSPSGQKAEYIRLTLTSEDNCKDWRIEIYRAQNFILAFNEFVFPPGGYGGGAAITFSANEQPLQFHNGEGMRALEMHGQMEGYATNQTIKYVYRGYTQNKEFAVYIQSPISAPILPNHSTDVEKIGVIPIPSLEPDKSNYSDSVLIFNEQAARQLASLPPNEFSPSLLTLDALVSSIKIEIPTEAQP
jgi:hypothetical protein